MANFESDLVNSYAWLKVIVFIQEFSGDTDYAGQISSQIDFSRTGQATDENGNDVRCNIYDMASCMMEWITETYYYGTSEGGIAIGAYNGSGANTYVMSRTCGGVKQTFAKASAELYI